MTTAAQALTDMLPAVGASTVLAASTQHLARTGRRRPMEKVKSNGIEAVAQRKFGGKVYRLHNMAATKTRAQEKARDRKESGYSARVVKVRGGYAIYQGDRLKPRRRRSRGFKSRR